jgi:hypothetical protein
MAGGEHEWTTEGVLDAHGRGGSPEMEKMEAYGQIGLRRRQVRELGLEKSRRTESL